MSDFICPEGARRIELGQQKATGVYMLVDESDYHLVSLINWSLVEKNGNFYAYYKKIKVRGIKEYRTEYLHRLLMGNPSGMTVDHINGDTLDNRRSNLRVCTHAENSRNTKMPRTNTSGYKGVHRAKHVNRWRAQIKHDGKLKVIGYFDDLIEAAKAYNAAAIEFYGEYARINNIPEEGQCP